MPIFMITAALFEYYLGNGERRVIKARVRGMKSI